MGLASCVERVDEVVMVEPTVELVDRRDYTSGDRAQGRDGFAWWLGW